MVGRVINTPLWFSIISLVSEWYQNYVVCLLWHLHCYYVIQQICSHHCTVTAILWLHKILSMISSIIIWCNINAGKITRGCINPIQDAQRWGREQKSSLPQIFLKYPTMTKIRAVMSYLKKIQKTYKVPDTPLEFC